MDLYNQKGKILHVMFLQFPRTFRDCNVTVKTLTMGHSQSFNLLAPKRFNI